MNFLSASFGTISIMAETIACQIQLLADCSSRCDFHSASSKMWRAVRAIFPSGGIITVVSISAATRRKLAAECNASFAVAFVNWAIVVVLVFGNAAGMLLVLLESCSNVPECCWTATRVGRNAAGMLLERAGALPTFPGIVLEYPKFIRKAPTGSRTRLETRARLRLVTQM